MPRNLFELSRHHDPLSLEKLALIRVTTILCNNRRLLSLITKSEFSPTLTARHYTRMGKHWTNIKAVANRLVSQTRISNTLKKKIMAMVWPVCYKIMLWKYTYAHFLRREFLRHFYWTGAGRIDNIRTMQFLLRNRNISVRRRFILACSMCLVRDMHEMWMEMSDVDKKYFCRHNRERISFLLLFWAHTMNKSDNVFEDYMLDALKCAIENSLLEAIKCLFRISSADERQSMAQHCVEEFEINLEAEIFVKEDDIDIAYFIFFEMSKEMQEEFYTQSSFLILSLLVHHPKVYLFYELLEERLKSDLSFIIEPLLFIIFYHYHLEIIQDQDYGRIFVEVWARLDDSKRNELLEFPSGVELLATLARDHFPFLLLKSIPFKNLPQVNSTTTEIMAFIKLNLSPSTVQFHQGKWNFLLSIISQKIVTINSLKMNKKYFLKCLGVGNKSKKVVWNRILRFVRRITKFYEENKFEEQYNYL